MEQGTLFGDDDDKRKRRRKLKRPARYTEKQFARFCQAHPEVLEEIVKQIRILKSQGYEHYGMKAFFERIRWHHRIAPDQMEEYKINNNYAPLYARMVMALYPESEGFFELRERGRKGKHRRSSSGDDPYIDEEDTLP